MTATNRIRPGWALAVAGLALVWLSLGALNVWILLRRLATVPPLAFLGVYVMSWATSLVIPGQLGDSTQVVFLRRWHVDMSRSGAAYVVDKAISLGWMLVVAIWGVSLYVPGIRGVWLLILPVIGLALVGGAWRLISRVRVREGGAVARFRQFIGNLGRQVRSFRMWPATVALNVTLTVVKWVVMAAMYLLAFRAFDATISPVAAATIPVIVSLIGYVPVTVAGAGTMEWTAVVLFGELGVAAPIVLVVYLYLRGLLIAGALVLLMAARGRPPLTEADPYAS